MNDACKWCGDGGTEEEPCPVCGEQSIDPRIPSEEAEGNLEMARRIIARSGGPPMKKRLFRINAKDIEDLYDQDRKVPRKFAKLDSNLTGHNEMSALRVDFVNYILSRLNDISLPFFTGKATRFELWVDEDEVNSDGEPKLSMKFWVPSPFPTLKRGLMTFEYPIN
jgi:hypothetical protein